MAIGVYPVISLAEAREKRDQAKKQIINGVDPSTFKKLSKEAVKVAREGNFEFVAWEWHLKNKAIWTAKHGELIIRRLENYVFPWLGGCQMGEISIS